MGFTEDLQYGEEWERTAIAKLHADTIRKMDGKFLYFDYIIYKNSIIELIEVKTDRYCIKSGNIAIEFKCNGKDSGITTSKADFWLIVVPEETPVYYYIPTKILKDYIYKEYYTTIKTGGDGNRAFLYLFHRSIFTPFLLE
jgi:hypothetical protein